MGEPGETFLHCVIFITFVAIGLLIYIKHLYTYFNRINVKEIFTPLFPFGNVESYVQQKLTWCDQIDAFYRLARLKKLKVCGIYVYLKPHVLFISQNLAKRFLDNAEIQGSEIHFCQKFKDICCDSGANWKGKISDLSQQEKCKTFYQITNEECKKIEPVLDEYTLDGEIKDVNSFLFRYVVDVSASCILGIHSDTLKNPECLFYKFADVLFSRERWMPSLKQQVCEDFPVLGGLIKNETCNEYEVFNFYKTLIKEVVDHRKEKNLEKSDILQMFIKDLADDGTHDKNLEIATCRCVDMFVHNLERCYPILFFCIYELSLNKKVQDKLRQEVKKAWNVKDYAFEKASSVDYLDQVIEETLRKYPPQAMLMKALKSSYKIPELDLELPENTIAIIPIYQIQQDPEFYLNPSDFSPGRFTSSNPKRPLHFTKMYEKCGGFVFSRMLLKLSLIHLLKNHEFTSEENEDIKIYEEKGLMLLPRRTISMRINHIR